MNRDALRADSDLQTYGPCHRRDGTAGTPEPDYRCYRRRASTLSVTTTGRPEQLEEGPCRRRGGPRDSHESAFGRLEQLADVGRSDIALRDRRLRDRWERVSPKSGTRSCRKTVDVACARLLL